MVAKITVMMIFTEVSAARAVQRNSKRGQLDLNTFILNTYKKVEVFSLSLFC